MNAQPSSISQRIAQIGIASFEWLQAMCQIEERYAAGWVKEREWSEELTKHLVSIGFNATHQCYYPGTRQTCDLVVKLDDAEFWLEIKGAWLTTIPFVTAEGKEVGGVKNSVYRKHLFHADESTLKDLTTKLGQIQGTNKYVGVLLVGFDSTSMTMDKDITELSQTAKLAIEPWTTLYRGWSHQKNPDYRCRNWFWFRQTPS